MRYATFLMLQGVSQSGAVEVVLGRPLSSARDRAILTKLALAPAEASLRLPAILGGPQRSAIPRPAVPGFEGWTPFDANRTAGSSGKKSQSDIDAARASMGRNLKDVEDQALSFVVQVALGNMAGTAADALKKASDQRSNQFQHASRVAALKARIAQVEQQLVSSIQQLDSLLQQQPPASASEAAKRSWQNQVDTLRAKIEALQAELTALLEELAAIA